MRDSAAERPDAATIRRLAPHVINQIAAGEVVTRPGAALKELIENALDAGARRIEITVQDDALSFSVRDDGRGMGEADLRLSIERHATSKITGIDDLYRLTTRGFRGEALAAIAAVSRLEIVTRRGNELEGLRLKTSGGLDVRVAACGAPEGTTVQVHDLFFNLPVRLRFLKSAVAEWGHMLQAIVYQSLTRTDVAFSVRWRGRPYMDLPAGQTLTDRLAQIWPAGAGVRIMPIDFTLQEVRVWGAVTDPRFTRRDRRYQYYFANSRPIRFRPLQFAMEEAYRGLIMTQQYPLCALHLELPGEMVDVNVHPTKEEVRFREEPLVTGAIHRAVIEALRAANLVPHLVVATPGASSSRSAAPEPIRPPEGESPEPPTPERVFSVDGIRSTPGRTESQLDFVPGFGLQTAKDEQPEFRMKTELEKPLAPTPTYAEPAAREEADLIARLLGREPAPRAVGQIALTYILAEAGEDGMLVIDQHAAHEKIIYMKLMRQAEAEQSAPAVQPLLIPYQYESATGDDAALEILSPGLRASGFDIEPFGGRTWSIQSVPLHCERLDIAGFLRDLLDDVGQGDLPRELRRLRERICARAACRAAVKAGDSLTSEEMQRLVNEVLQTGEALRCPHGRPTILLLTRDRIDRQFGRI